MSKLTYIYMLYHRYRSLSMHRANCTHTHTHTHTHTYIYIYIYIFLDGVAGLLIWAWISAHTGEIFYGWLVDDHTTDLLSSWPLDYPMEGQYVILLLINVTEETGWTRLNIISFALRHPAPGFEFGIFLDWSFYLSILPIAGWWDKIDSYLLQEYQYEVKHKSLVQNLNLVCWMSSCVNI